MFQTRNSYCLDNGTILVHEPVYLRQPNLGDHEAWAALREQSRGALVKWEDAWSLEDLTAASFRRKLKLYAAAAARGRGLYYFVFSQKDNALLGGATLSNIVNGAYQAATISYWIGSAHQRCGFGAAAVHALQAQAFETLGLRRLVAACQPENVISQRLLLKCGFRIEGRAIDYLKINGEWRDHLIYARTSSEYCNGEYDCRNRTVSGDMGPADEQ